MRDLLATVILLFLLMCAIAGILVGPQIAGIGCTPGVGACVDRAGHH